jgi:hypothetical protein
VIDFTSAPWLVPAMTALSGGLAAIWCAIAVSRAKRRCAVELDQVREEFQVMLAQQRMEVRDSLEELGREVESIRNSRQEADELLRESLSPSVRAAALRLLRSGVAAETMASTLSLARSDARLIASVSRMLAIPDGVAGGMRSRA